MSIKKLFNFLNLLYKNKGKITIVFLNDEIDVHSYFFQVFLDGFLYKIEISDYVKVSLEKLTQSKSSLLFDPQIAYQSFKLPA